MATKTPRLRLDDLVDGRPPDGDWSKVDWDSLPLTPRVVYVEIDDEDDN